MRHLVAASLCRYAIDSERRMRDAADQLRTGAAVADGERLEATVSNYARVLTDIESVLPIEILLEAYGANDVTSFDRQAMVAELERRKVEVPQPPL